MENLIEGLQRELNRVRELLKDYEELPNNAGLFGSIMLKKDIANAEKAIATGDTIEMIRCYKELEQCQ